MHADENRRMFERYPLPAMYTALSAKAPGAGRFTLAGHAYDISEGGVQFELDRGLEPGTPVVLRIDLPRSFGSSADERPVVVHGNVVWKDESEPGPVRMAVAFTRFARKADEARLKDRIGRVTGGRRAA